MDGRDAAADESDLPFRQVARDLPTPCWIADAEGAIIWVNSSWLAYTGLDVPTIRAQGLEGLHDPQLWQTVRRRWAEVKASGQAGEMQFPLRGKDGRLRPFLTRVVPVRDASGAVHRWFGTNTDISAQSEAERKLQESQERLQLATEAAQLGVWDWDLIANTFVYSPRAREICGFPPDIEVTYADVAGVTHPDDYPRTSAMAQRAFDPVIRANEPYRYRLLRRNGELRWVHAHGRVVFESHDGVEHAVRYVGTLQDITDQVNLEDSLRESETLLRSVFDVSALFIAVLELTDEGFRYVMMNRATTEFYGLPPETSNIDARELGLSETEISQWRQTLQEVCTSGVARTLEYAFSGGRGERWYLGTYTPLASGPGVPGRASFVVIDVTDRKLAEERQTLLMREVDHRAKNALTVAQAIVQLTRNDDPPEFKRAVQGRIASLARAHTLLAAERWTGADLRRLITDELAAFATDRPSRLSLDGPPHVLDPAAAQSVALVIHELGTNAVKHGALSRPDGDLSVVWTTQPDGGLHLRWRETSTQGVVAPVRHGFGFSMMDQSIRRQLGGEWRAEWAPTGLTCTIELRGTQGAQLPEAALGPSEDGKTLPD